MEVPLVSCTIVNCKPAVPKPWSSKSNVVVSLSWNAFVTTPVSVFLKIPFTTPALPAWRTVPET